MNSDALSELKRVKRKKLRSLKKTRDALNLKMIIKGDEGIVQEDHDLFHLEKLEQLKRKLEAGEDVSDDDLEELGDLGIAVSKSKKRDKYDSDNEEEMDEWEELKGDDTVDPDELLDDLGTGLDLIFSLVSCQPMRWLIIFVHSSTTILFPFFHSS